MTLNTFLKAYLTICLFDFGYEAVLKNPNVIA
jgi:hypothetical protein